MNFGPQAKVLSSIPAFLIATALYVPAGAQVLGSARLNIERRGHTATELSDGRVLVVGGENAAGPINQAEIFDPGSQTFISGAVSAARTDHAATLLPDGRVLVTGGRDGQGRLHSTELFSPQGTSFSPGTQMRRARSGHTATVLGDGKILLAGGDAEGSAEIYDPGAESFSLLAGRLKVPRALHGAALLKDRRVLIAGGVDPADAGEVLASAEIFDPQSSTFARTGRPMQTARGLPALRVLPDGKVQVIGGDSEWSMEMFDPAGNSFLALAHLPPSADLVSPTLNSASRSALIATTIAGNPAVAAAFADPALAELMDRSDHSLTELSRTNQALVSGGVDSSGEFLSSSVLIDGSPASVTTDKFDYPPGQTVKISGAGWQPGETVLMVLREEPETHPDRVVESIADSQGGFINTDFAPAVNDVGRIFTVTAMGQSSGRAAQTAFMDSQPSIAITAITGNGAACGGATVCLNPVHLSGTASVLSFSSPIHEWEVQVDWGDGAVDPNSTINFLGSVDNGGTCVPSTGLHCRDFSGTWSSSPDHTYATGGPKTITVKILDTASPSVFATASTTISMGKRSTSTAVAFSNNPIVETQSTTATVTVTDTEPNGVKSNPGVGATVAVTSDSGDTISGVCTLAALSTDKSTCSVTVTANSASTHTITATFSATAVHSASAGSAQLAVTPHTIVIQNLSFTPQTSATSPRIAVSHDIEDIKGDQTRDRVITTAQNIPGGCKLGASPPLATKFNRPVAGLASVTFKAWEIGRRAWAAAKRRKCEFVELKIISFSVQTFHNTGSGESGSNVLDLNQAPFSGTLSICFSVPSGAPLPSCPVSPLRKNGAPEPLAARLDAPLRE
jgi:hypothetical protein